MDADRLDMLIQRAKGGDVPAMVEAGEHLLADTRKEEALELLRTAARRGSDEAVALVAETIAAEPGLAKLQDVFMLTDPSPSALALLSKSEHLNLAEPRWLYGPRPDLFSREQRWRFSSMKLLLQLVVVACALGGAAAGFASAAEARLQTGAAGIGLLGGLVTGAIVYGAARGIFFAVVPEPEPDP